MTDTGDLTALISPDRAGAPGIVVARVHYVTQYRRVLRSSVSLPAGTPGRLLTWEDEVDARVHLRARQVVAEEDQPRRPWRRRTRPKLAAALIRAGLLIEQSAEHLADWDETPSVGAKLRQLKSGICAKRGARKQEPLRPTLLRCMLNATVLEE